MNYINNPIKINRLRKENPDTGQIMLFRLVLLFYLTASIANETFYSGGCIAIFSALIFFIYVGASPKFSNHRNERAFYAVK